MSKYFAKWLPVPREPIGYDEFYINKVFKLTEPYKKSKHRFGTVGDYLVEQRDKRQNNDQSFSGRDKYYVRVKLFLCSRDIQVGDTYYYSDTETDVCDSNIRLEQIQEQEREFGPKRFKVVGEISSEAVWVKEGDEWIEEEVRERKQFNSPSIYWIKGPCGHFH